MYCGQGFLDSFKSIYYNNNVITPYSRHDSDGFLTITGRIKELIITAGGENISPVAIEDNIRRELPDIVSNVMAVGDRRKHLTCLVTLRVEVDEATAQPTDRLDPAAAAWCEAQGVSGLVRPYVILTSDIGVTAKG